LYLYKKQLNMFQASDPPKSEEIQYGGDPNDPKSKLDFVTSQKALSEYSNRVLQTLTQTRERVFEIQSTIINSVPAITRLGGQIQDVSKTISEVALASRRNVIASEKDIEGLFAVTQVLGGTVESLANAFLDVGRGIETIPEELEKSVEYIQSIGGNARSIMADVTKNMGVMNRFQFNEGVQGLTKMAAQASMLRFDMTKTFEFAENLYKPEEAIKVAAAFQRMGVAIGGLGDPLQLMNQSINDPSGLQDSLVEVSKQFTYLDKQTNTFKISRQGVLILKELGEQAGIDAKEMMKMGLAAAELDQRLSAINEAGLTITSEEDKQYLANIAKMKDGKYTVELVDEQGKKDTKNLSDITQKEFDKLIKEQREGPKGLEETARAALRLDEIVQKDINAIRQAVVGGALGTNLFQSLNEDIRKITDTFSRRISKSIKPEDVTGDMNEIFKTIGGDIRKILTEGVTKPEDIFKILMEGKEEQLTEYGAKKLEGILDGGKEMLADLAKKYAESNIGQFFSGTKTSNTTGTNSSQPVTSGGISVGGIGGNEGNGGTTTNPVLNPTTRRTDVNFDGGIDINVKFGNVPVGLTPQQRDEAIKMITESFKTLDFQNYIKNLVNPLSPVKT
jgi:hypothetical protein